VSTCEDAAMSAEPDARLADRSVEELTAALATDSPVPGGGTATALAASLASGLTSMVVRLSQERPAYEEHATLHAQALSAADDARQRFLDLADEDASAYTAYVASRRLPKETDDERVVRAAASREAARLATTVPLSVVQLCHDLAELVERLAGRTNVNVASDLDIAALLLDASARGAAANAIANLDAVDDVGFSDAVLGELDHRLRQIHKATARTRERVRKDSPREPEQT
jgi:formiminotetrahydrofolate cyclodeaminase